MKKSALNVLAALAAGTAVALGLGAKQPAPALAEDPHADLAPIEVTSDIDYYYFDAPSAVFADSTGLLVPCADRVWGVSPDGSISVSSYSAVDKAYRYGSYIVALENGGIAIKDLSGNSTDILNSAYTFVDFDIDGSTLYALASNALIAVSLSESGFDATTAELSDLNSAAPDYRRVNATAITVGGGKIYIALDSDVSRTKQDIAVVDMRARSVETALILSYPVISMTKSADGELYVLMRDKLKAYSTADGELQQTHERSAEALTDVFAYGNYVYAIDSLYALYKISGDLSACDCLIASAYDANGFFDMPSAAAVKNSTLYVADTGNDRIAVYGDTLSYITDNFVRPVSVACDTAGTVYVVHSGNKIDSISGGKRENLVSLDSPVRSIVVNADKTLYILADSGIWSYDADGELKSLSTRRFKAITLGHGKDDLYALDDGNVYKFTFANGTLSDPALYTTVDSAAFSLAVDIKGSVFALSRDGITCALRTNGAFLTYKLPMTVYGEPYELDFTRGEIVLSTVHNGYIEFGDVIIIDGNRHRAFTADGKALGVVLTVDPGEIPDKANDREPEYYGDGTTDDDGLIRYTLYDVEVFEQPMEKPLESPYKIKAGTRVIVPQYTIPQSREYSLILVDRTDTDKLIQGYVYKDALSPALRYTEPPDTACSVYSNATPIYKWPSPNSITVRGHEYNGKGTSFELLSFVYPFYDYQGDLWYRVKLDDKSEGYVKATNISLLDYVPEFIRPAYNAEIISYKGSENAIIYDLVNGEYVQIGTLDPLATGTKVEVVGTFDTSLPFTKIKYLDPVYGTRTCYVRTEYIKYNGVNVVLLVAIVVIVITVILGIAIIARVLYVKRKRLVTPSDETDNK